MAKGIKGIFQGSSMEEYASTRAVDFLKMANSCGLEACSTGLTGASTMADDWGSNKCDKGSALRASDLPGIFCGQEPSISPGRSSITCPSTPACWSYRAKSAVST